MYFQKLLFVCVRCNKEFLKSPSQIPSSKCCSKKCFSETRFLNLNCPTCGRDFKKYKSNMRIDQKEVFCSTSCNSLKFTIQNRNENKRKFCNTRFSGEKSFRLFWHYHDPHYVKTFGTLNNGLAYPPQTIISCNVCSKKYTKTLSSIKRTTKQYCSRFCMDLGRIEKLKLLKCSTCYELFIRTTGKYKDHKKRHGDTPPFCSRECFNDFKGHITRPYEYCKWCENRFDIHSKSETAVTGKSVCCTHKCRKLYEANIGTGRVAWNRGNTILPQTLKAMQLGLSKYNKKYGSWNRGGKWTTEKMRETARVNRSKMIIPYNDTSIEIIMQKALNLNGIKFEKHKPFKLIKRYTRPDIFIEPNICVECDGDYWHRLPDHIERDNIVNFELRNRGYIVLRFWEKDINKDVQQCVNEITKWMVAQ